MNTEAWPFLITRNKVFDYRTVIAPQFMVGRSVSSLLAKATKGDPTSADCAVYREVHGSPLGDISLIFRIVQASNHHLGLEGSDLLRDQFGRPINLIEGLVVKGRASDLIITYGDLTSAHRRMEDAYRAFWDETVHTPSVQPSAAMVLAGGEQLDALRLQMLAPLVISPEAPGAKSPESLLADEGDLFYADSHYDKALESYTQALAKNPTYTRLHIGLGNVFYQKGDYELAERAFRYVLTLDPQNALAYNGLGNVYDAQKRFEEALACYDKAVTLDFDCGFAYFNKAETLQNLGREGEARQLYERSLAAFENMIRADPENVSILYNKMFALESMGRSKEVKETKRLAQEIKKKRHH